MKVLLDTHFVIWIVLDSSRLKSYPWLSGLMPWGVSPVSILELKFLAEVGRIELSHREFLDVLKLTKDSCSTTSRWRLWLSLPRAKSQA